MCVYGHQTFYHNYDITILIKNRQKSWTCKGPLTLSYVSYQRQYKTCWSLKINTKTKVISKSSFLTFKAEEFLKLGNSCSKLQFARKTCSLTCRPSDDGRQVRLLEETFSSVSCSSFCTSLVNSQTQCYTRNKHIFQLNIIYTKMVSLRTTHE